MVAPISFSQYVKDVRIIHTSFLACARDGQKEDFILAKTTPFNHPIKFHVYDLPYEYTLGSWEACRIFVLRGQPRKCDPYVHETPIVLAYDVYG